MAALFHHLTIPDAPPDAWVRRSSLRSLFRQIGATTLAVDGHNARETKDGIAFSQSGLAEAEVIEEELPPWSVSAGSWGFVISPGWVMGLTVLGAGSTFITPRIGDFALDADRPPELPARFSGVIAIEIVATFLRGTGNNPYSEAAQLDAVPQVKWLADIETAIGVIDGTAESHGVFAVPLAIVDSGRISRLRWGHVFVGHTWVTSLIA